MAKTNPLTNTEVKQAKPRDKIYKLADGDGLQLRIMPSGSKCNGLISLEGLIAS